MGDIQLGGEYSRMRVGRKLYSERIELLALEVKLTFGPPMARGLGAPALRISATPQNLEKSCNPVIKGYSP